MKVGHPDVTMNKILLENVSLSMNWIGTKLKKASKTINKYCGKYPFIITIDRLLKIIVVKLSMI